MHRRFATLDVFTDRRFAGNALAVVLNAEGLAPEAMQAIAREFSHPETVFVFPASEPSHRARLRIFTPARELPFAGHPTVGTAVLLGRLDGGTAAREIVLEENIGPVRCVVEPVDAQHGRARFTLPQLPSESWPVPENARIAATLALPLAEIGSAALRPSCWSAGVPMTMVPVATLHAIRTCRPDPATFAATFGETAAYVFCREALEPGHAFHARMFAPTLGVAEDPATGSAAAAFAGLLAARASLADGDHVFAIEQGYEMGRPSLIQLALRMQRGKLASATVGGDAVGVTEGTIEA
jgi:trans-2,3-dihydro-3-hydroxyanthranilate isomerase